jgi:hypothetical protein
MSADPFRDVLDVVRNLGYTHFFTLGSRKGRIEAKYQHHSTSSKAMDKEDVLDHHDSIDFAVSATDLVEDMVRYISGDIVQRPRSRMRPDYWGFCDLPP